MEREMRSGRSIRIEALLAESPVADADTLLGELLLTEVSILGSRGDDPSRESYLTRFPDQTDVVHRVFDRDPASQADSDSVATTPGLRPGTRLGDFRIRREIARGGMGVVYEATQENPERRVALKVLPAVAALDDRQVQRFEREGHVIARLHHPHIVQVYRTGSEEGTRYIAMQYIDGVPLNRVWQQLPQDSPPSLRALADPGASERFDLIARFGRDLAGALSYAHSRNVIHRDVKPSNVLLDGDGQIHLTDFGLAQMTESGSSLTLTGEFVGTLRYAAPEAFEGAVGTPSDIYSLGVTLYELVGLQPAFSETSHSTLIDRITRGIPTPWPPETRAAPRDLQTIICKAMSVEPELRYSTAGEMADDLARFLRREPIRARQSSLRERLVRWCQREPRLAGLAGGLVAVLLIALVAVSVLLRRANTARDEMITQRNSAASLADRADRAQRLANEQLLQTHRIASVMHMEQGDYGRALFSTIRGLRLAEREPGYSDVSGISSAARLSIVDALRCRASSLMGDMPVPIARTRLPYDRWTHICVQRGGSWISNHPVPCLLENGRRMRVSTTYGTDLLDWEMETNRIQPARLSVLETPDDATRIRFTADGDHAVVQRADLRLELWDVGKNDVSVVLQPTPDDLDRLTLCAMSPDDSKLVVIMRPEESRGFRGWLYDIETGLLVRNEGVRIFLPLQSAEFSRDGQWILIGHPYMSSYILNATTFARVKELANVWHRAVFDQGGHRLASVQPRGIDIWDLDGLAEWPKHTPLTTLPVPATLRLRRLAFDPSGDLLIAGDDRGSLFAWKIPDGSMAITPCRHARGPIDHLVVSPDGRRVAVADAAGRLRVWSLESGCPLTPVLWDREPLGGIVWDSGGELLGFTSASGELMVVRIDDHSETAESDRYLSPLSYSPHGRRVLTQSRDGVVTILDTTEVPPREIAVLNHPHVCAVAWSRSGDRVALLSEDPSMRGGTNAWLWDFTRSPKTPQRLIDDLTYQYPPSISFLDNDRHVATASHDGVRIAPCQVTASSRESTLRVQGCRLGGWLAATPGRKVAFCSRDPRASAIRVWDIDGQLLFEGRTPDSEKASDLTFTPNGKYLVVVGEFGLRCWETQGWTALHESLTWNNRPVQAVYPGPSGRFLAVHQRDGICTVIDLVRRSSVGGPMALPPRLLCCQFTPRADRLLTASRDEGLRVWDWQRGEPLSPEQTHMRSVRKTVFSPTGTFAAVLRDGLALRFERLPQPSREPLDDLIRRAQITTTLDLSEDAVYRRISADRWNRLRHEMAPIESGYSSD